MHDRRRIFGAYGGGHFREESGVRKHRVACRPIGSIVRLVPDFPRTNTLSEMRDDGPGEARKCAWAAGVLVASCECREHLDVCRPALVDPAVGGGHLKEFRSGMQQPAI